MKTGDIDIDFGDRSKVLEHLKHTSASMLDKDGRLIPHKTGVYFTEIPSVQGQATIDYKAAEERGYFKVDLLNVHVYEKVKSKEHLDKLIATEPPWEKLKDAAFCAKLIHIGNWHSTIMQMPEPIDSIPRLAMFLAIIRPGKKHLVGKTWKEVSESVWDKTEDGYSFKKAHAVSYSHLVVAHMNLLNEQDNESVS